MWHKSEFVALQKLVDSKFDSKLEDVLFEEEIAVIKKHGKIAWENLRNRVIVPVHNQQVFYYIMIDNL